MIRRQVVSSRAEGGRVAFEARGPRPEVEVSFRGFAPPLRSGQRSVEVQLVPHIACHIVSLSEKARCFGGRGYDLVNEQFRQHAGVDRLAWGGQCVSAGFDISVP